MAIRGNQPTARDGIFFLKIGWWSFDSRGSSLFFRILLLLFAATCLPVVAEGNTRTMNSVFGLAKAASVVFLKSAPLAEVESKKGLAPGSEIFRPTGSPIPINGDARKMISSLGATELVEPGFPWSGIISTLSVLDAKGNILAVVRVWAKFDVFSVSSGRRLEDGSILTVAESSRYSEGANRALFK